MAGSIAQTGKVVGNVNYLRAGVRIPVELPAQVRWKSPAGRFRQVQGKTASMSGNGMLIAVPVRLRQETLITVTVTLPVEITRVPFELECQARVVRQIPAGRRVEGIGAIIDDYRFQPAYRPA